MKKILLFCACLTALFLSLTGCNSNVPTFVSSDHLTRITVMNQGNQHQGLASTDRDNLNELLNTLHLSDITAASRQDVSQPASPAYTIVAFDGAQTVWTVQVPDAPTSSHVYFSDAVHPANTGMYPLKQAIKASDLDQFITKYPSS